MTILIRGIHHIPTAAKHGVVTIGNFDGVHLGHRKLIEQVLATARKYSLPSIVVTFEPHAFEFFNREKLTIPRITRFREKFKALANLGVDFVLLLPFNHKLADTSASEFITDYFINGIAPKQIIVGDDFRFGKDRAGDFNMLKNAGREFGFSVTPMPTYQMDDARVSSTRVRNALLAGDINLANRLLGRPYVMSGRVRRGDQRGRQWGFPTANIFLHRKLTAVRGVFAVRMIGIDKKSIPGVANIGMRPTVNGTRTLLEVNLFDFNRDIYGRYVDVEFCQKLRDEQRYADIELLKAQIAKDVEAARKYFQKQGVL